MDCPEYRAPKVPQAQPDPLGRMVEKVFPVFPEFQDPKVSADPPESLVSKVIPDRQVSQVNRASPDWTEHLDCRVQLVSPAYKESTVGLVPWVQ